MIETTFAVFTAEAVKRELTGVLLSRIMVRAKVELAAAQLVKLTPEDAGKLSLAMPGNTFESNQDHPVFFCLFKGEDAAAKVSAVINSIDFTFGNGLAAAADKANFPQVMSTVARISKRNNLLTDAPADDTERTLLIIKPENFRAPSTRPGAIIDMLTSLDLQWIGCKVHHMTTNDALEFYGPVQQALRGKLGPKIGAKALAAVENDFSFKLSGDAADKLIETVGNSFADDQFEQIVEFMSGKRPSLVPVADRDQPGGATCMVLIFDGVNAVDQIRTILGPTNPAQATGGTIRYDFGTDIMVNASHASDSVASYERESVIVRVNENDFCKLAQKLV